MNELKRGDWRELRIGQRVAGWSNSGTDLQEVYKGA